MIASHVIDLLSRAPEVEPHINVSPDGMRATFVRNDAGVHAIHVLDLASGAIDRISPAGVGCDAPHFSRDGRAVFFARDHNGDECWDLYRHSLETRSTECLLVQHSAGNANVDAAPDHAHLLLTSAVHGRFTLCELTIDMQRVKPLTTHAFADGAGIYSPDGAWIAFDAHTSGQDSSIFIMRRDGSELRELVRNGAQPCWSPDGTRIAFHAMRDSDDIGVCDVATGMLHWLAESRWDERQASWSPDGRLLAYIKNDNGAHSIIVARADDGAVVAHVAPADGVIDSTPRFARNGESVLFIFSNHRTPGALFEFAFASGTTKNWTPAPLEIETFDFVTPFVTRYESEHGLQVPAIVYPSRSAGPTAPAVLIIHGGPTWAYHNFWHPMTQLLAAIGCTVIGPNYRGSTGYGRAYQNANRYDLGRGDVLDCIAGVDWLIDQKLAGRDRIGVTGASQGGYMTMMCLAKHPGRWRAGSSLIGYFNYFTEFATEREDLQYWDLQNMGDPATPEGEARFRERSPIFFIDNVTAPVQLLAGRNDPRCPAAETEDVHRALTQRGIPVDIKIYEDEGHGFVKVDNFVDAAARRVAFFDRHLNAP